MKKLILFNHFHNGDIFYSRVLLKPLLKKYNITYYHKMRNGLFSDIPEITEYSYIPTELNDGHFCSPSDGIINTWIGHRNYKYLNAGDGCTHNTYMKLVNDIFSELGMKLDDEKTLLPFINFEKVPNNKMIDENLKNLFEKFEKKILISTGEVYSEQSTNFDFTKIVDFISNEFPNYLFLTTTDLKIIKNNVVTTEKITNIVPDLLQIGYISKYCDIIIGRSSGPYCFTHFNENLMDIKKLFIDISRYSNGGRWYEKSESKFVHIGNFDIEYIKIKLKEIL